MENPKRIKTHDRLSELPDPLIFQIFWFLPITEVVRTTILSKRWEDLWNIAPFLNLDDSTMSYFGDYMQVRDFMNRALILWRGIKILKFKIDFDCDFKDSFDKDIDVWVRFAKQKAAAELELHLRDNQQAYLLPRCLYSCSLLKSLSLKGCRLRINGNVRWDCLKSLTIHVDGNCLDQHVISQVLLGSPRLEVFVLALMDINYDFDESLCIRSSSLKRLSIEKIEAWYPWGYNVPETPWGYNQLKIRTPNLETLEILGLTYHKCSLNASSLTDVTLGIRGHENFPYDYEFNESLEETLGKILLSIRHVESLTLSDWCVKVLRELKRIYLIQTFPKVKFLKLNIASFSKHKEIAGLLELFPKLKRLVVIEEKNEDDEYKDDQLKFETNLLNPILLQLTTVEVTWAESDNSIFPFIEILLKYARNLEKMVIRVKGMKPGSPPSKSLFSASQKLLRMPRSSTTSQLIFCEY